MISSEVEMHRHNINNAEMDEDDQIYDGGSRGIAKRDNDQPKRSPIRRKTKMRKEEERIKPKAKRNHKREKHRIKHEWQGEKKMQYSDRSNPSKFVQNVDYESFLEDSDLSDFEMYEKIYHFEDSLDLYDSDDYFGEQD